MRILLIEDDKALCQVLQPTLQAAGFASDCCHTGADGLHLLKTGYYDACILDRMLPELDGLTLLKSARADGVSIPVLMLTALGQIGDRVDGLDAGADDYLAKPFEIEELDARLRALLRRSAGQVQGIQQLGELAFHDEGYFLLQGQPLALTPREQALLTLLMFPFLVVMYSRLAVNEEKDMRKQFGAEFDAYAARTPRFLPSLSDTRQRG